MLGIAVVTATAGLVAACGGRQEPVVTDQGVPAEVVARFLGAMDEFDPETLRSLFTENAKLMPPNVASVTGGDAIVEYYKGSLADELDFEFAQDAQGMSGGLAATEGTYKVKNLLTGEYIEEGKWMAVWVKAGADWKIARLMSNTDSAVRAPVVELEDEDAPAE